MLEDYRYGQKTDTDGVPLPGEGDKWQDQEHDILEEGGDTNYLYGFAGGERTKHPNTIQHLYMKHFSVSVSLMHTYKHVHVNICV